MKDLIEALEKEVPPETEEVHYEDWSASRAQTSIDEKVLMAKFFARHHFLVREGHSPEEPRETVASIILNHGTTPNSVLQEALHWIKDNNKQSGPFFLTWYTPGHLIPTTLKDLRDQDRGLRTALKLFLFPGEVDEEIQSVLGRDAEIFAENLQRHFTYAFLSAYAFDLSSGARTSISRENSGCSGPARRVLLITSSCSWTRPNSKALVKRPTAL